MTEIDYLKAKLEDKEKAFDKLYGRYLQLLKEQGEVEKENEELKEEHKRIIDLLDKKLQENTDNDEYARKVKIDLIMELKKELEE